MEKTQEQIRELDSTTVRARIGFTGYHRYLPFDVPSGVRRIRVCATAGLPAAFGIALFDPRGAGYQSPGFRGSAGAEHADIVLGTDDATPGFLPGPLPAGRWTLAVPVFAALPGTTVRVEVSWKTGTAEVAPLPSVPVQVSQQPGWYRGDLHCHTTASSDALSSGGALDVAGWVAACRRLGLDLAAMTDHNTVSQNRSLTGGGDVLLLAGEEMTNYFHGHALVVGLPSSDVWLDWRQRPRPLPLLRHERRIDDFYATARQFGAFTAAAHPNIGGRSWQFMLDALSDPTLLPDGIEVWNAAFTWSDQMALRSWDRLLRRGRRLTGVGGSDLHDARRSGAGPGMPTTIIGARSLSRAGVVEALHAGRVTLSAAPDGPELYVEARGPWGQRGGVGDTICGTDTDEIQLRVHARRAAGARLVMVAGGRRHQARGSLRNDDTVDLRRQVGAGGYVRFELRTRGRPSRMLALTNPVFLVNGRPPDTVSDPAPEPPIDNPL